MYSGASPILIRYLFLAPGQKELIVGENITFNQLMDINIQIKDLGLLYKVDVVNYNKNVGTPIGEHIDRVGLLFYEKQ